VDDGSQDRTADQAAAAGAKVIRLRERNGKGGAMAAGAAACQGDIVLFLDADLLGLRPEHVETLAAPVLAGRADMVVGLFRSGRLSTDLAQRLAPGLSGQRALRRALLPHNLACLGYAVESALEECARQGNWRVRRVALEGVSQVVKEKKRGFLRGAWQRWKMYQEIAGYKLRPRRQRPLPALPAGLVTRALLLAVLLGIAWYQGQNILWARAESAVLAPLPEFRLGPRVLVVSPHPDDESLGAGGLIAQARREGREVRVVWMTAGDGFRRGAEVWFGRSVGAKDLISYGRLRSQEAARAAERLGIPQDKLIFLGYPDGGLARLWWDNWRHQSPYTSPATGRNSVSGSEGLTPGAPYAGEAVLADLRRILKDYRPTDIFVTDGDDSHRDHQATRAFLLAALAHVAQQDRAYHPRVYTFLIHHGAWEALPVVVRSRALVPPASLLKGQNGGREEWRILWLSQESLAAKHKALQEYRTQQKAMEAFLKNFLRPNEVFRDEETKIYSLRLEGTGGAVVSLQDPKDDAFTRNLDKAGDLASLAVSRTPSGLRLMITTWGRPVPGLSYRVGIYRLPSDDNCVEPLVMQVRPDKPGPVVQVTAGEVSAPLLAEQPGNSIGLQVPLGLEPGDALIIGVETRIGPVTLDWIPWSLLWVGN
ncbi:MAG: PIG-L family deacetylase, partial [Moorellales bacterium]